MVLPHSWTECRAVLLSLDDTEPVSPDVMDLVWTLVPDADRRLFHEFCCLNRATPQALAAADRIGELVRMALNLH